MNGVAVELKSKVHRLRSQFHDASNAAAQRHDPSTAVGHLPVGGDGRLPSEVVALLQVVVDEILEQKLIHVGQIVMAGYRPNVVHEKTQGPFARLHQDNGGGPNAEFSLAQNAGDRKS